MSQSSEQIEAKLCAYLEGELDEQGRAEIEKHLQANPAHRKLLAEVAGTRGLLRALPRESAPPDLCETLQGHLERSVLLGDTHDDQARTNMRIGRWKPMLAMAAMVVLAVGLGLVIYFGLPSAATNQRVYTVAPPAPPVSHPSTAPATTVPSDGVEEADGSRLAFRDGVTRGLAAAKPDAAATPGESSAVTTSPAKDAGPESLTALAQRVPKLWSTEQQREFFGTYARRARAVPGSTNSAVYFVLSTPQPAVADEEVRQELEKLQVQWEAVPGPTELAMLDGVRGRSRDLDDYDRAARLRPQVLKKATGEEQKAPAAAGTPAATTAPGLAAGAAAPPAPDVASAAAVPPSPSAGAPAAPESTAVATDKFNAPSPAPQGPAMPADGERMIVARNLTRRQAETLRASLSGRRAEQQVAVWSDPSGAIAPSVDYTKAKQESAPSVGEQLSETTRPAQLGRDAAANATADATPQVALRSDADERQVEPAREPMPAGRGGIGGGGGGIGGKAASPAPAEPGGSVGRSRPSDSSFRELRQQADRSAGRGASRPATATAPSQAKEDVARRGLESEAERGEVRVSKARPSPRPDAGRNLIVNKTAAADNGAVSAEPPPGPGGNEAGTESAAAPTTGTVSTDLPATVPSSAPSAAPSADDERVDLVIVVTGPAPTEAAPEGAPGPAAAAPAGPIEKFEILTVTLGDAATNVRVAADGTIDLPSAGRIAAEGLTVEALGKRIGESLKNTDPAAKVTVTRPDPASAAAPPDEKPETQPQPAANDSDPPKSTQPAPQPSQEPR